MAAVHRILGNHRNDLVGAIITSTGVKSSTDIRLVSTTQTGNAAISLTGPYTGAADTAVDVEIVDTLTDTIPRVSSPSFSGVGNGLMTVGAVTSGAPAQTITVTLTDTGTMTTSASLDFDEVVLQAKSVGDDGNGIQIAIDRSGLVFTPTTFSLLNDLTAGTDSMEGPEYEWSSVAARSDGTVPDTAKRLVFGEDPTIYRQWKSYSDGGWKYHLYPALERAIPKKTKIVFVSGGRTVTVSQGATTETYTDIITPYDLLSALQKSSALIDVVGVVTPDKKPGGMAMRELRARTDAHALPTTGDGSQYATGFVDITVDSDAATELLQATCWAISNKDYPGAALGKELWQLAGSVSGTLATHFVTGERFNGAGAHCTIPQKLPDGYNPDDINQRGRFRIDSITYAGREADNDPPPLCVVDMVLGVAAVDKTLTCVYKKRPGEECACEEVRPEGRLIAECLGLDFIDGGDMTTDAWYISRLQALAEWHSGFTRANTAITAEGELRAARYDLQLADLAHDILWECLEDIYNNGVTTQSLWEAAWTAALTEIDSDLTALETLGAVPSASSVVINDLVFYSRTTYVVNDLYYHSGNNAYYKCTAGGEIGDFPLESDALFSGKTEIGVTFAVNLGYSSTGYPPVPGTHLGYAEMLCISKEDAFGTDGGTNDDINATADLLSDPGIARDPETWKKRFLASANYVRAVAGLPPKKIKASMKWNACWRDNGDDYYWEINGTEYLPAFTNRVYHASAITCGADGENQAYPTHEFAFAITCKCPEKLLEDDTITLVIGDAGWPATYQVGDVLTLPVIAAAPLELAGGIDGNDLLTWAVNSSTAGALTPYTVPLLTTPAAYTGAAAQFTITPGTIPFATGDAFTLALEGGHFRWRRDSGSWSATTVVADSHDLGDGLTLGFAAGPPPSLVTGDSWQWQVTQPYSPVSITTPVPYEGFEWEGSSVTLMAGFPSARPIPAVMIALHTLPLTATVTLAGSLNNSTWWTVPMPVQAGPVVTFLAGKTAQYLELRIAGAAGARIGWWWVGTPFQPSHNASTLTLSRVYGMARGGGLNPAALYRGQGRAGELAWDATGGGWLEPEDMAEWLAHLDHAKAHGDEPFCLTPNVAIPAESALVVADGDEVVFSDVLRFQDSQSVRYLSASIPLRAVLE